MLAVPASDHVTHRRRRIDDRLHRRIIRRGRQRLKRRHTRQELGRNVEQSIDELLR
jgi:hypothetical protein